MTLTKLQQQKSFKNLVVATLKIILSGGIIGLFHAYDFWVGLLLFTRLVTFLYKDYFKATERNWILLAGMIITGFLGVCVEIWGISFQYWEYHDLTNNRQFPYWLPFAWMFAFRFIYMLESKLIISLGLKKMRHKTWLAIFITAFFPAFGEVITINLGVWTYSWPYQILGVPIYAIVLLVIMHMGINFVLGLWVKKKKINDPVFVSGE